MPDDRDGTAAGRTKKRLVVAAGGVLAVAITVLGVLQLVPVDDPPDPAAAADPPETHSSATEVTNQFLDAFTSGDATAAGALTDDAAGATTQLSEVWRTLTPASAGATRTGLVAPVAGATAADEPFTLTWELGAGRSWTYESVLRLVKKDAGWLVRWQPTLVHPRLSAGQSLALHDLTGRPAVRDRAGAPLLTWTETGTSATDPAVAPLLLPGMGRLASGREAANGWYVALVDASG